MARTRLGWFGRMLLPLAAVATAAAPLPHAGAAPSGPREQVPPLVALPADQGPHSEFANEWWYTVGHLVDSDGRAFGFELSLYRFATDAEPVYRADVSITDVRAGRFHRTMSFSPPVDPAASGLDVRMPQASLIGTSPSDMRVEATLDADTTLDLHLTSSRPAMPVRAQGFVPFGNGATYWYALTKLEVSGWLQVDDTSHSVTGTAWQDHQWGNWTWDSITGWTAMVVHLDNDVQVGLADRKGPRPSATLLTRGARLRVTDRVTILPTGEWRSPSTGIVYEARWRVHIRGFGATLSVEPVVADQELPLPRQGPVFGYWVGKARVSGTWRAKPVEGQAYVELLVRPSSGGSSPPGPAPNPEDLV
jgi:predicted secreted hydrolase